METLLSQAEQLPGLLAASRSGLVRTWSPETLSRSLSWARFFQQLHRRLGVRSGLLRASVERRLSRAGLYLGHLRRCPELLALALLENRALPAAARRRLLRNLLFPEDDEETPPPFVHFLARRKAASQLLLGPLGLEGAGSPAEKAQGQLLLCRLREGSSPDASTAWLEQLPRGPALYQAVAAALLEPGREAEEACSALLPWLLPEGGEARLAEFCRFLPAARLAELCSRHPPLLGPYLALLAAWGARLEYDPLRGEWRGQGGEEEAAAAAEVPWEELAERLRRLAQETEPRVGSAVRAHLRRLRAQEGDFGVRGLSVWTDLLLDLEGPHQERKPPRPQSTDLCD